MARHTYREDFQRTETDPHGDPNLRAFYWRNTSKDTHIFESYIHHPMYYPQYQAPPQWQVVRVKPGEVKMLPHRYYKVSTHDGRPVTGQELRGRAGEKYL